ncbi:MAG: serine/threonine protein kinase [Gemmatimonadota bacterium]|nr:serine/threonine protein kinase [Gemmatimonadota bacterium]
MDPFRDELERALAPLYVIERELGGGGMSRVFLATELSLARKVVIKVLPPELAAGVNSDRFRREIQLAAQLHHPHIVPLLSAGEAVQALYYTMPYIEGESLRARLRRQGKLPVRDVVRILHDVIDALAYAHERGIIHRDIKPDNILTMGAHGLVTDFGVAKALTAALPITGATTAGIAIGTPAYMAPEQLAADPSADHRIDIYAVGLLAYELLTGESPFSGPSPAATMAAQLTRTPEPLHLVVSDVPPGLSSVIMRCLEKSPENRPETAAALLDDLDAVTTPQGAVLAFGTSGAMGPGSGAASLAAIAEAPTVPIAPPGTRAPPATRWWTGRPLAIIAAMFIAALAFVAWITSRPLRERAVVMAPPSATSNAFPLDTFRGKRTDLADVTLRTGKKGATSPRGSIVLSHAESVAIANAIRKQMEPAAPPAASASGAGPAPTALTAPMVTVVQAVKAESLAAVFQRTITDSLRLAMAQLERARLGMRNFDPRLDPRVMIRESMKGMPGAAPTIATEVAPILAPPTSGKQRIVVLPFRNGTSNRALADLSAPMADALRTELVLRKMFDVVDAKTTSDAAATSRDAVALGWTLRADLVLTGLYRMRNDSLVLQLLITDVRRGRVVTGVMSPATTLEEPMRPIGSLADHAVGAIVREGRMEKLIVPPAPPMPPVVRP